MTRPRILITAGPTREPIDAVRFLSNRASGRIGLALAAAAYHADCPTTLLLGPTAADPAGLPPTIALHRFETTDQLARLLDRHQPRCDLLIMAAAVADYRPLHPPPPDAQAKLSRAEGPITLQLRPTEDLIARCAQRKRPGQMIVGFALDQPDRLEARAAEKLRRKQLDAIIANPLRTMDAEDIDALLLTAAGRRLQPGPMTKADFARWLIGTLLSLRPEPQPSGPNHDTRANSPLSPP